MVDDKTIEDKLPDVVDISWSIAKKGMKGIVRYNPDLGKYNDLFIAGRETVCIGDHNYIKTIDEAFMKDNEATAHLQYQREL
jgi:hypothetical protein